MSLGDLDVSSFIQANAEDHGANAWLHTLLHEGQAGCLVPDGGVEQPLHGLAAVHLGFIGEAIVRDADCDAEQLGSLRR